MNIAVIGAGNVGSVLGTSWSKKGHSVVFGVRNTQDPKFASLLKEAGNNARAASVAEAAKSAEVVVLATPWPAARDAIKSAGDLRGKVFLDCTNPLKSDLSGLETAAGISAAEQIATWASGARVVKIFNTTGSHNMENPRYPDGPITMLYCGDDTNAKKTAAQLATDLGFDPVDAGALTAARWLESFAMLWIHLALHQKFGVNFAFRLVRR